MLQPWGATDVPAVAANLALIVTGIPCSPMPTNRRHAPLAARFLPPNRTRCLVVERSEKVCEKRRTQSSERPGARLSSSICAGCGFQAATSGGVGQTAGRSTWPNRPHRLSQVSIASQSSEPVVISPSSTDQSTADSCMATGVRSAPGASRAASVA